MLPEWFLGSFPSFAFTTAVCIIGPKWFSKKLNYHSKFLQIFLYLVFCLTLEFLQVFSLPGKAGVLDVFDVIATLAAGCVVLVLGYFSGDSQTISTRFYASKFYFLLCAMFMSAARR